MSKRMMRVRRTRIVKRILEIKQRVQLSNNHSPAYVEFGVSSNGS